MKRFIAPALFAFPAALSCVVPAAGQNTDDELKVLPTEYDKGDISERRGYVVPAATGATPPTPPTRL